MNKKKYKHNCTVNKARLMKETNSHSIAGLYCIDQQDVTRYREGRRCERSERLQSSFLFK